MSSPWKPVRTVEECNKIISGPGSTFEVETQLVGGRVYRVYKNLWPSLRAFFLWAHDEYKDKTYVVSEDKEYTYRQTLERAAKAASIFTNIYGLKKGDRVGICSRNYPEYLVVFWACHLIGAVPVMANAWLPPDGIHYCISHTQCSILIVDPERANILEPEISQLQKDLKLRGVFVLESHEGKGKWSGMLDWKSVFDNYRGDVDSVLKNDPNIIPEDHATIYFTSGTTGRPKGVLSTQRQYLTNVFNAAVGRVRDALRRGIELPTEDTGPQKGVLIAVPFFHVTGTTSQGMSATMNGLKIVLLRRWNPEEAVRMIKKHNVAIAGGVPSMVVDLLLRGEDLSLESLTFGGTSASPSLASKAAEVMPNAALAQGYGMTECNSVAVSMVGMDQVQRPTSTGLATPVNDLLVMDLDGVKAVPAGAVGEVWIRGVNVMKEYWRDPDATNRTVSRDGWLKTGDLGYLDEEGFLYIKDRIKDIIIRGGENIDSVSVENAFYALPCIYEAAAVGVPDPKLGELVAVAVSLKPGYEGKVTETELVAAVQKTLPRFAVPVMIIMQSEPLERTASGKIVKGKLRQEAAKEWEARKGRTGKAKL
ncbi:acetyl-CoA synthetase-like protein [Dendrothele bispora CBS 962.96]|uniref:Acetyl-CoA synthetase-like protein n=1 Tax=Dendrothele bispora (strain CBS 962.96) TaxID=1314807 RepID=A0A4S8N112_DENBC|nr:acetyl-CoA synthetase-like protein [Dendrothele bispora CBS 962.96]